MFEIKEMSRSCLQSWTTRALLSACAVAMPVAVSAGVTFSTGTDNTGTDNVLFNACSGSPTQVGLTVTGCLNTNHSLYIDFTGTESLTANGGQASIEATSGSGFTYLKINMQDPLIGFTKILFNVDATFDGTIDILADLFVGGSAALYSTSMSVDSNGENKFIVESNGGDVIKDLYFQVDGGTPGHQFTSVEFTDTKQVRIGIANAPTTSSSSGNPGPNQVPEPGTLSLLGLAALFSGPYACRRRRTGT